MKYRISETPYFSIRLWVYINGQRQFPPQLEYALKALSLWGGADKGNGEGYISYEFMPEYRGAIIRLMQYSDIKENLPNE